MVQLYLTTLKLVLELIDNAVKFAREGAKPNVEDLTKDVYLNY